MSRPWYRWPENKQTGIVPWFVMLRRLLLIPTLYLGLAITAVSIALGYSWRDGINWWKNKT
jgi:NADH:ubiquinone oxidoreductase subunit 3 (subunit A)